MLKLYDSDIEKAVIGCIVMKGNKLFKEAAGIVNEEDFHEPNNRACYSVLQKMFKQDIAIDLATITEYIDKKKITDVPIMSMLQCTYAVSSVGNFNYYIKIIKDYSYKRAVLQKINEFKVDKADTQQLIENITNIPKYEEIKEKTNRDIILETINDAQRGTDFQFSENFGDINHIIGGVDRGDLIILGGYPSNGKSSLMVNFAVDFCNDDRKVLICTLEMPPKSIMRRVLAHNNWINTMHFRTKDGLTEQDKNRIKSNIDIIDNAWKYKCVRVYTIPDIIRAASKYKPDILFIDYLQNISGDDNLSLYAKRTKHVQEIQRLAHENDVTTFLLSQFNRPQEGRIARPHNNNLRDSGAIEERADIIFLIYWERKLKMESLYRRDGDDPEYAEINITKSKDGATGGLNYNLYPECHRWVNPDNDSKTAVMYKKAEEASKMQVRNNTIF